MPDSVKPEPQPEPIEWAVVAARAAHDKSADDVLVLEVGPVLAVCEHFVITSGSNVRLVRAIVDEVEARVAQAGGPRPIRVEGLDDSRWVLLDYGDFVVHVFLDETRRYYDLERLWSDVPRVRWQDDAAASRATGAGAVSDAAG